MKALPAPEPEKKAAIQPTEVWSPSMGTEVMPVAGEIAVRPEGLRCNCCGELDCPWEPFYRNYRGQEYRYVAVDEMAGYWRDAMRYSQAPAWLAPPVPAEPPLSRPRMFSRPILGGCAHSRKRYQPSFGWRCNDCGEKVR